MPVTGATDIDLIAAPSNLGLRPPSPGREPGAWLAPQALLAAGLEARLRPARLIQLPRPPYDFDAQPGTRIRNGLTIREHALELADAVEAGLSASRFAVVLGGDCSILLGCLLAARRGGRCGLLYVDGHSDFFHPGNYDADSCLGAVAGMALALATGRGEPLLTHWPQVGTPLVADDDAIQIGDRDPATAPVARFTARQILHTGVDAVCDQVAERMERRGIGRAWLHLDLDVLDQTVLPAVDSPGSPGLDFPQLARLVSNLIDTGLVLGVNVTIYDPELDPTREYPPRIVDCLATGLASLSSSPSRVQG